MVELARVRTVISGWPGAPGLHTQYFKKIGAGAWGAYDAIMTDQMGECWTDAADLFPSTVTFTVQPLIDVIEDTTGEIQETLTGTTVAVVGTGSVAALPTSTALCVSYQTAGVVAGKHVRGRSFLSPLALFDLIDTDGTPNSSAIGIAQNFGNAIQGVGTGLVQAVVWSRPKISKTEPGEYERFGSSHAITSATVIDKYAVLRSRRD
jgi:hypothetical protein